MKAICDLVGFSDWTARAGRERRNTFMPDGDMTILSMAQLLRRWLLVVSLSALAGCAVPRGNTVSDVADQTLGTPQGGTSQVGTPQGVSASPASGTAQSFAAQAASKQASGSRPAYTADAKAPSARIFRGSGVLLKPTRPETPSKEPADVALNFDAADIREIAKLVLADILGESYIVDPRVQGSISFRTTRPLPRSALLPTLETVLRMNGIALVKESGIFKIIPAAAVRGSLSPKTGGAYTGYTVQIVPLKFLGAREMARILEPFAPDANAVKVDVMRNLLILAGTQNEIGHMLDTVDMFDVDWLSGMSVGVFTLQSADVKMVDAELKKVLGETNLNPLAGMVRVIPIRSSSLSSESSALCAACDTSRCPLVYGKRFRTM